MANEQSGLIQKQLIETAANEIYREYLRALGIHEPIKTRHEGYAVILEELDELWEAIRNNEDIDKVRLEAAQVGAMALRFIVDIC